MSAKSSGQNEFIVTLSKCLLGIVIAIALGCFIGYGILLMIGHETDMTVSNRYLDRVSASRAGFIEQGLEYQQAADALRDHTGIRVLRTASGKPLYWQDGQQVPAETLMDTSFAQAVESLFLNSSTALSGQLDVTGEPIDDLLLYNIAVDAQNRVYYYLYYDQDGYICAVYDEQNSFSADPNAVVIMEQWYLLFDYGELDA